MKAASGLFAFGRLFAFALVMSLYFLTSFPFLFFLKKWPLKTRSLLQHQVRFYARVFRLILGLKAVVHDPHGFFYSRKNFLIVCNHLSYLDILVACDSPCLFVTSQDMRKTPFLGWICELAGCVFVERRRRDKEIFREIKTLRESLKGGLRVTIFPEGTSGNGEEVGAFKSALFEAALAAETPVLPAALAYTKVGGEAVNPHNKDRVCWYGGMSFFPHFWSFLKAGGGECELKIFSPLFPDQFANRMDLAKEAHKKVKTSYGRPHALGP